VNTLTTTPNSNGTYSLLVPKINQLDALTRSEVKALVPFSWSKKFAGVRKGQLYSHPEEGECLHGDVSWFPAFPTTESIEDYTKFELCTNFSKDLHLVLVSPTTQAVFVASWKSAFEQSGPKYFYVLTKDLHPIHKVPSEPVYEANLPDAHLISDIATMRTDLPGLYAGSDVQEDSVTNCVYFTKAQVDLFKTNRYIPQLDVYLWSVKKEQLTLLPPPSPDTKPCIYLPVISEADAINYGITCGVESWDTSAESFSVLEGKVHVGLCYFTIVSNAWKKHPAIAKHPLFAALGKRPSYPIQIRVKEPKYYGGCHIPLSAVDISSASTSKKLKLDILNIENEWRVGLGSENPIPDKLILPSVEPIKSSCINSETWTSTTCYFVHESHIKPFFARGGITASLASLALPSYQLFLASGNKLTAKKGKYFLKAELNSKKATVADLKLRQKELLARLPFLPPQWEKATEEELTEFETLQRLLREKSIQPLKVGNSPASQAPLTIPFAWKPFTYELSTWLVDNASSLKSAQVCKLTKETYIPSPFDPLSLVEHRQFKTLLALCTANTHSFTDYAALFLLFSNNEETHKLLLAMLQESFNMHQIAYLLSGGKDSSS